MDKITGMNMFLYRSFKYKYCTSFKLSEIYTNECNSTTFNSILMIVPSFYTCILFQDAKFDRNHIYP